jgi:opacity protein-like surface antigen
MRIVAIALSAILVLAIAAPPVLAQTAGEPLSSQQPKPAPPPKPQTKPVIPRAKPKPGFAAYGLFDYEQMAASDTFNAIFDKSSLTGFGFGAEGVNLYGGLFARVTFSRSSETGSRVAIIDNEPVSLNIPLELKLTTTEAAGGWRFAMDRLRKYSAYGGVGVLFVNFKETSQFAESGDDDTETFTGYDFFGGIDAKLAKYLFAGAEVQYRLVPDALGEGGASQDFGETDLGGFVFRVLFGFRK